MKNRKLLLCAIAASGCALGLVAQSKIDPRGLLQIGEMKFQEAVKVGNGQNAPLFSRSEAPDQMVTVFADMADLPAGRAAIEERGYQTVTELGSVIVVRLPLGEVEDFSALKAVRAVEFDKSSKPMMDRGRQLTNVDLVHTGAGEGLNGISYTGRGVIASLYDTGVDPNHVAFKREDGTSRVLAVIDQRDNGASLYSTPEDIAAYYTDNATETHGTHVGGIMAGSFKGNGTGQVALRSDKGKVTVEDGAANPYYGAAPDAELVLGCGSFMNSNVMAGTKAVVKFANETGKPAVLNLSLGNNSGPHDGNTPTAKAFAQLGEKAIICMSAGNEGDETRFLYRKFNTVRPEFKTFLIPKGQKRGDLYASTEFWFSDGDAPQEAYIILYNEIDEAVVAEIPIPTNTPQFYFGNSTYGSQVDTTNVAFDEGFEKSFLIITSQKDAATGRYNISMQGPMMRGASSNTSIMLGFRFKCAAGKILRGYTAQLATDNTPCFSSIGLPDAEDGSAVESINDMACADNVICVGAYIERPGYPKLDGGQAVAPGMNNEFEISPFSSYGTRGDTNESLPHVAAPGSPVVSALSTPYAEREMVKNGKAPSASAWTDNGGRDNTDGRDYWGGMHGTSMSSPFVAGIIALWLEANPNLTFADVKEILKQTSIKDEYTKKAHYRNPDGSYTVQDPDKRFGYGKIDALAGVKMAVSMSALSDVKADDASSLLIVENLGGNRFNLFLDGSDRFEASLYALDGTEVAAVSAREANCQLDASQLAAGVYILAVEAPNARAARKLIVR